MHVRIVLAAGIAALVAGCGGGSSALPGAGGLGAGAAVVPADVAAFVAVDSDVGSSQWQAVDSLLEKAGLLDRLQQGFQRQTGISWDDLKAALGPELDVVLLPGASPKVVLLTQPSDTGKLDALLERAGPKAVSAQVNGWTAVSDTQSALDAVAGATRHLADASLYQEASGKLTGDAFAHVYANGAEAAQLASSFGAKGAGPTGLVWAAADVVASEGGLKLDGYVRRGGSGAAQQPYASRLVDRIPGGALLVADFQARHEGTVAASTNPILSALGKVGRALGGETALYVTPALPFPAVTLVTHASDPQAVLDALDQALHSAGTSAQGLSLGPLIGGLRLSHEVVDGDLVVSTSQAAIAAFKGGGAKLAGDAVFREAQSASGMPADTTGFVYVDLKDTVPYVKQMLGGMLQGSGQVDLSALRTLVAYGTGSSGDVARFAAFLEVR
jgi:hypothetical protein